MTQYELVIVGSGPTSRSVAMQARKLRRRVLVVESSARVEGISVHSGTIPSNELTAVKN